MASQTITAMFENRADANRAAAAMQANKALAATSVKVLPEHDTATTVTDSTRPNEGGFMNSLRNFFMPEEDRAGYAEGLRRGSIMVAVETDSTHAHQVMDALEESGAIDLDEQEAKWRSEGWKGYDHSSSATASAGMVNTTGATAIPPTTGTMAYDAAATNTMTTETRTAGTTTGTPVTGRAALEGTDEVIPLVEETLRVGKRQVVGNRVRIRSYVVETPVNETVHLHDEHVHVERRPVDRPLTASDLDPFREREIEATETREEAVVSKEARVREELVMRKTVQDRDEVVHDTVRRTEVREDNGDVISPASGAVRNPDGSKS